MQTFTADITTKFSGPGEKQLFVSAYISDKSPALMIYSIDGVPLLTASVAVEGSNLEEDCILIKNWSENEGIEEALITAGLIGLRIRHIPTGLVEATMHRMQGNLLAAWKRFKDEEMQKLQEDN